MFHNIFFYNLTNYCNTFFCIKLTSTSSHTCTILPNPRINDTLTAASSTRGGFILTYTYYEYHALFQVVRTRRTALQRMKCPSATERADQAARFGFSVYRSPGALGPHGAFRNDTWNFENFPGFESESGCGWNIVQWSGYRINWIVHVLVTVFATVLRIPEGVVTVM